MKDSIVNREVLSKISNCFIPGPRIKITNKVVIDLYNFYKNDVLFTWKAFAKWVFALAYSRPSDLSNNTSVCSSVRRLLKTKRELRTKRKKISEVQTFSEEEFVFPRSFDEQQQADQSQVSQVELPAVSPIVEKQTAEINNLLETIAVNGEQMKLLIDTIKELTESKLKKDVELSDMKKLVTEIQRAIP